ncbi:MAG: hypothetical protein ACREUG_16365, partial [Steroidobacteraceae bacterium]
MAEHGICGVRTADEARREPAIERSRTGVTAFVGRALKGPLHRPVRIRGFADYQRTFGGLWQPSML